jgi:hypothetical protein
MGAQLAVADALVPLLIGIWAGAVLVLLWRIERLLDVLERQVDSLAELVSVDVSVDFPPDAGGVLGVGSEVRDDAEYPDLVSA